MITSMKQAIVDGQLCFFETLKRKNERRKDKSRSVVCSSKKETKKTMLRFIHGKSLTEKPSKICISKIIISHILLSMYLYHLYNPRFLRKYAVHFYTILSNH